MPKQTAVAAFLKDIYAITRNQALDLAIINKETFDKLLVKHGISDKDVSNYIVTKTKSNVYFDTKLLNVVKEIVTPEQFLNNIKNIAISRLPRAIHLVVDSVPLMITDTLDEGTNAEWNSSKGILINKNYLANIMTLSEANINSLLHFIGHEYWHAFSYKTNFRDNLKGMIKDKTKNILQKEFFSGEKVKTIDDLIVPLNFIEEITEGGLLNDIEKEYIDRWGTAYIKNEAASFLENNLYKHIDKASIRGSLDEMMAEALGYIVSGAKPKTTNRGVNFILQKLASTETKDRIEKILDAVDVSNPDNVRTSVAKLLTIIENCDDCGL